MNRLHHLKKTLIQNIHDNADYENTEFLLLNYNSSDGMEEWVRDNLMSYIESGKLIYYKTTSPNSWNPSHSKNLAFKLATGDILCNIWADYYTGSSFSSYVNESFQKDDNIVLTPIDFPKTRKDYSPPGDVLGKVCVKKSDFLKIRGFDERIDKHGFEDYDFVNRLEMIGIKRVLIEESAFLNFVHHDNTERFDLQGDELEGLYIHYVSPSSSEILILFNDGTFYKGTIIDNTTVDSDNPAYAYTSRKSHFKFKLLESDWLRGKWEQKKPLFVFTSANACLFNLVKANKVGYQILQDPKTQEAFFLTTDSTRINSILEFKHFYDTRKIMEDNLNKQLAIVNIKSFGDDRVV